MSRNKLPIVLAQLRQDYDQSTVGMLLESRVVIAAYFLPCLPR